jgi:oligo-1,6-glucosidase
MRVNDDYAEWNAAKQLNNENSVWAFWRQALRLRKEHDLLVGASFLG